MANADPWETPKEELPNFDGKTIEFVLVKLNGGLPVHRRLEEGSRISLAIEGTVKGCHVETKQGVRTATYTVKVDTGMEPEGDMADKIIESIRSTEDQAAGRESLDFPETDDPEGDGSE